MREDIICEQPFYYRAFPAQKIDSSFLTLGLGAQRPSLCIGNDFKTKPAPNRNCKEMIYNSIFKRFMNAFLKLTALSSRGKLWGSNPHHWRQSQIHNPGLNSYSGLVLGILLLLLSTVRWAVPSGEFVSCQVTNAPTIWLASWSL